MRIFKTLVLGLLFMGSVSASVHDPQDDPLSTGPTEEGLPDEMLQYGCQSFYSLHPVPREYARERLPVGIYTNSLVPHGPALLAMKAWTCDETLIGGEAIGETTVVLYYISVRPYPQYASSNASAYWYPVEVIVSSPRMAQVWQEWTFSTARAGAANLSWEVAGDTMVVQVDAKARGALTASLTVNRYEETGRPFLVRYFATQDGGISGGVDIKVHPHRNSVAGPTLVSIAGEDAPAPVPLAGISSYQGWEDGSLSYTWTPVAFSEP